MRCIVFSLTKIQLIDTKTTIEKGAVVQYLLLIIEIRYLFNFFIILRLGKLYFKPTLLNDTL